MALPDCDRCHSCFSIFTSPAATPSSIVPDVTASHTPDTCGPGTAEPAFVGVGRWAAHPAAPPIDAITRAILREPTKPERIRTKTSRRCHLRVYTIKIGSDGRRATPNRASHAGMFPFSQSDDVDDWLSAASRSAPKARCATTYSTDSRLP